MPEPRGEREVLAQGRFLRLVRHGGWEHVERTNATGVVMIVATTEDGGVLLVEQFRPPVGRRVLELPAGLVGDTGDAGEGLVSAARRELLEETGYAPAAMMQVTEGPPSPGDSSASITMFRATGCRKVGAGGGDAAEDIAVHDISVADVDRWLADRSDAGVLVDPLVFAGLYFCREE